MNQYRPLNDHVYEYVISLINDGKIAAGDRVSEQMICESLGVSRTPVREALIKLCDDGYLDNEIRKGFRVHEFDDTTTQEVYQVMGALDAQAACLASNHLTEDDYSQMQFLIDSMSLAIKGGLVSQYDELQRNFHNYYVNRCGNKRLRGLIEQQGRFFLRKDFTSIDEEKARELAAATNEGHQRILDLLREKKLDELANYVRCEHWQGGYAKLFATKSKSE